MKNILSTTLALFILFAVGSCEENDKDPIVQGNGVVLRSADAVSPVVLTYSNNSNVVATLDWDKSNNGPASVPTYTVVVSDNADSGHANELVLNGGNSIEVTNDLRTYVVKVGELNAAVNMLTNARCGQPIAIDIRVKSTLGIVAGNAFVQYSNPITITVTPYSTALPTMSFATAAQIAALPQNMAASGIEEEDYEGYVRLTPGIYNFYKPDACNGYATPTMYGDDGLGTFNTLAVGGSGYTVTTTGNYRVIADTMTGLYSVLPITSWGVIGTAKVAFPGSSTNPPLIYYAVDDIYKTSSTGIALHGGKTFRFRANNTIVLAQYDSTKTGVLYGGPTMSYNGIDVLVPGITDQFYDITLDLSSPRNYKYTLVLH